MCYLKIIRLRKFINQNKSYLTMLDSDLIHFCEHLELIPLEKDVADVKGSLKYLERTDLNEEERQEVIEELKKMVYEPRCKMRYPCIITESSVLSQGLYGFGNFHQPFNIIRANSERMNKCSNREFMKNKTLGIMFIDKFLLTHIKIS
jgi:hypothetical protein